MAFPFERLVKFSAAKEEKSRLWNKARSMFSNAFFKAGTDISAYCNSIGFDQGADALDKTAFGDSTKINAPGLKTWGFNVQGHADFADDLVDELLAAAVGTSVAIEFKPVNAAVSASNPLYNGTGVITGYNVSGSVEGIPQFTLNVEAGSALTRSVS